MARLLTCLLRGHSWDVAPRRASGVMRCVRCGVCADPVPHLR